MMAYQNFYFKFFKFKILKKYTIKIMKSWKKHY